LLVVRRKSINDPYHNTTIYLPGVTDEDRDVVDVDDFDVVTEPCSDDNAGPCVPVMVQMDG